MRVIEKKLWGKQKKQCLCEDGLFINDNFIAVIDGVTAKGHQLWDGLTSGNYAKNLLYEELETTPYYISAKDLLYRMNNILLESYIKKVKEDTIEEWLRASVIVYSKYYKEIWSYGDCHCMINDNYYTSNKKIDVLNAELRCLILNFALLNGVSINELQKNDIGREILRPFLKLQLNFENEKAEFGYPVLNGHKLNLEYLKTYSVNCNDMIILASDGYPYLMPTLAESEIKLEWLIKNDPLCFKIYKSTKGLVNGNYSFDDRCYCRFIVE